MERTLTALFAQSRKPDEVIVLASDIDLEEVRKKHTGVTFYAEPNLNDWGHAKRAKGLDLATKDYIGWFNHDDSYDPHYIAEMMWLAELGSDVVYCGWSKNQLAFAVGEYYNIDGNAPLNVADIYSGMSGRIVVV